MPKAAFRRSVRAGPSAALSSQPAGTPDCSRQRGPSGAGRPACLPPTRPPRTPGAVLAASGSSGGTQRARGCGCARRESPHSPSPPSSRMACRGRRCRSRLLQPPAAAGLGTLSSAPGRPRHSPPRPTQTGAAPSSSRAEPSPSGAAHSGSGRRAPRPAPPRPAGPRMEGRSAQPHRACPPPPFRVPRPTPASRRAVRVHPLGPAPRLSGHGVRGAVRCALRSPSKGLRVCASRAALTGP